ncbi:MAG: cya [Nocardioides sp.]|nr:cya [Nocardioides sp.]
MTARALRRTSITAAVAAGLAFLAVEPTCASPALGAAVTCEGLPATIAGSDAGETLTGTQGDDVIAALGGDDVVDGLGGKDVICGDDGADVLRGGPGADRLLGGLEDTDEDVRLAGDSLMGGPGDDFLDPGFDPAGHLDRDHVRWGDSPRGVTVDLADGATGTAIGPGHDTVVLTGSPLLVGSRHDDTFRGSPGRDRVNAGGGSDTIALVAGDDDVHPDAGRHDARSADVVRTGPGDDSVTAFSGRDRAFLGAGRDQYTGYRAPRVEVHGQGGSDFISAAFGSGPGPLLRGGGGEDYVTLTTTFPSRPPSEPLRTVVVDARSGRVAGFENYVLFESAHWDFRGTSGPDHVQATGSFDVRLTAHTHGGNDYVEGSGSNDLIDTGRGRDRVLAGDGRDRCLHAEVRTSCEVIR